MRDEPVEPNKIDIDVGHLQPVALAGGDDDPARRVLLQRAPKLRDVDLHERAAARWRPFAPQDTDDLINRDRFARPESQQTEQALPHPWPDVDGRGSAGHRQGTQNVNLERTSGTDRRQRLRQLRVLAFGEFKGLGQCAQGCTPRRVNPVMLDIPQRPHT